MVERGAIGESPLSESPDGRRMIGSPVSLDLGVLASGSSAVDEEEDRLVGT